MATTPEPDEHARTPVPRPIAWMDGRVVPASEATVPLLDDGFLRGDGVFDAVLVRAGRTHALDAHLARLRRSARALGIRVPVLRQAVTDLLAAWGEHDGVLRIIVTRSGVVRGLIEVPNWPASAALEAVEVPAWRTSLTGVKSLSYAANVLATRRAREQHADDAIVTVDGVVHELPTAAIVWVRDGTLHAPDPDRLPILDSVTLSELQRVVDVELGVHDLDDILGADEVFVVSASRPVHPVHAVGEREYPAPGPLTSSVRTDFDAHVQATLDRVR
jgi:branched-chain amino acid aminotransferase